MAVIKASKREQSGTRKARALRKQGLIPAVVYGHGEPTQTITISEHEIELAILHGERVLEVDLEGKTENVLLKDVQYDTFGHEVLHVDMTRVKLDERVSVTVRIVLRGTPAGLADGGSMQQSAAEVELECVVTDIPDELTLQVHDLQIGDVLHASDLELPEGAILVTDPETPIGELLGSALEARFPIAVLNDKQQLMGVIDRASIIAEVEGEADTPVHFSEALETLEEEVNES